MSTEDIKKALQDSGLRFSAELPEECEASKPVCTVQCMFVCSQGCMSTCAVQFCAVMCAQVQCMLMCANSCVFFSPTGNEIK